MQLYLMGDTDHYNSIEFLIKKVDDLKQELQEVENKYDYAIERQQLKSLIGELALDIQNIKRKLLYFSNRLKNY